MHNLLVLDENESQTSVAALEPGTCKVQVASKTLAPHSVGVQKAALYRYAYVYSEFESRMARSLYQPDDQHQAENTQYR